jgi:hypothetical protein
MQFMMNIMVKTINKKIKLKKAMIVFLEGSTGI